MASAIMKMVPDALEKGEISLFKSSEPEKYGDGDQIRDFLYVKDAVAMAAQFLTNDKNGVYNIGTGKGETWNSLAKAVFEALGLPVKINYIPMPKDLIGKYQNYTVANMDKSLLAGISPAQFSLKAAVKDYVTNYLLQHKYW